MVKLMGFTLGASLSVGFVYTSHVGGSATALGAHVRVVVPVTGELSVSPSNEVIEVPAMMAGGENAEAVVTVRNKTGVVRDLVPRAEVTSPDMLELLQLRLQADGETIFDGSLNELTRGADALTVESGESLELHILTWIDPSSGRASVGRNADVTLHFAMDGS